MHSAEVADEPIAAEDELKQLVAQVHSGNVQALCTLGGRLLLGERAPLRPVEGVSMLREACAKGHAEAAAQLSVLHALGLYVPQGWNQALSLLVLAAQRGHASSLAQLRILAQLEATSTLAPTALAARVKLDSWVVPPAAVRLSQQPQICSIVDFLPAAVCDWLIERSRARLQRAQVYDAVTQQVGTHQTRTNSIAIYNLRDTDLIQLIMQARMAVCTGLPFRQLEASSVLHYSVGQTISNHYDFIDPRAPDYQQQIGTVGQRVITFLVYLNDDYEGGATGFPEIGLRHKGRKGEGLFFVNVRPDGQPDLSTLHAGEPPTTGEKWIVSQFIRDRAVF